MGFFDSIGKMLGLGQTSREDVSNKLFNLDMGQLNTLRSPDWINNQTKGIGNFFNMASQNLYGNEQRDMSMAGNRGLAQASAMNLSNPLAMQDRAESQVGENYAWRFGGLATAQAQTLAQLPKEQQQYILQLLGNMNGLMGGYQPGFNFMRDALPGLISAGSQIGSAYMTQS
jgi:hypothetical protein